MQYQTLAALDYALATLLVLGLQLNWCSFSQITPELDTSGQGLSGKKWKLNRKKIVVRSYFERRRHEVKLLASGSVEWRNRRSHPVSLASLCVRSTSTITKQPIYPRAAALWLVSTFQPLVQQWRQVKVPRQARRHHLKRKYTRNSAAVALRADRTAYDVRHCYRRFPGIALVNLHSGIFINLHFETEVRFAKF